MNEIDKTKVAAVVVTYNRLTMLKECIDSLRTQTYKNFTIVIINNGSTDGTTEYLQTQTDLIVINQKNVGGAGGFHRGMKYMYDNKEFDALWMMDDDGLAAPDQLAKLIKYSRKYNSMYCNALVINRNNRDRLCSGRKYDSIALDKTEFIPDTMFPFNGTFVWRCVIERIGLIKKEMFIWGDEREYTARVKHAGYKIGTVTQARHYHPAFKGKTSNVIPFVSKWKVVLKPSPRDKIFYRNIGYIDSK